MKKILQFALCVVMLAQTFTAYAEEPVEKRGVREDGYGGYYEWSRYKVPNSEHYIAGSYGFCWIEDEDGNDLTPIYQGLGILCKNSGTYIIYNGNDNYGILTKNLKRIDLAWTTIPYCMEFDGFYVLAGTYCSWLPYDREHTVYYDIEGNEIADIDAYLAERGTTLESALLDKDTSKDISEPFYDTGLFKRPLTGERYTDKSLERNGNFYGVNKIYISDEDGNRLSEPHDKIEFMASGLFLAKDYVSGKLGVLPKEYCTYSVISVKDIVVKEILPKRDTPYRCVDLGKEKFIFPVGASGEYYDENGGRISDLSAVLKRNNADLSRSKWAEEAITKSLDLGYIPPDISFNYKQNITRREFCELFMRHIKETYYYHNYSPDFAESYESPFTDIDDYYVSAANAVGIVQGVGDGKFEPDREITRQEAAVMLCKAYKYTYLGSVGETPPKFSDDDEISDWAKEYVYNICTYENDAGTKMMSGTGDNKFSPNAYYTREQAVATLYRMFGKDYGN